MAVDNSTACQVIGREFHPHAVAQQDTDIVLAHFARKVSQYLVTAVKPHTELRAWQGFNDGALYVYLVFFLFDHYGLPFRVGCGD
jgi:hypothetical protein